MPRVFDQAKAERAVAEAQVIGYAAAAKKHHVTLRTIYNWRDRVGGGGSKVPAGKSPKKPRGAKLSPRIAIHTALIAQQKRLALAMRSERKAGELSPQTQSVAREVERLQAELAELDAKEVAASAPMADVVGGGGEWLSDLRSLIKLGIRRAMVQIQQESDPVRLVNILEKLGGVAITAEALGLGDSDPGIVEDRRPPKAACEDPGSANGAGNGGDSSDR